MKTLFLTVGGSSAPLVTAICEHRPDHVVFICSENDRVTERRGSDRTVDDIIGAPEISRDAKEISYESIYVAADMPADIIAVISPRIDDARRNGDVVVDYTGGTKSMSAALFFVGVSTETIVSVVTGPRPQITGIERDQRAKLVVTESLQLRALEEHAKAAWGKHAYADAADQIRRAHVGGQLSGRWHLTDRWLGISEGFAAWDCCDYKAALAALEPFARFTGEYLPALRDLSKGRTPQLIVDLYFAAERRARGHQHDAAVIRLYRVLEGIAQWALLEQGHHTSEIKAGTPLADLASKDHNGKLVLSCLVAWRGLARLDGPLKALATRVVRDPRLARMLSMRNECVLAHGFRVLAAQDFDDFRSWIDEAIWSEFVTAAKLKPTHLRQLPRTLPSAD